MEQAIWLSQNRRDGTDMIVIYYNHIRYNCSKFPPLGLFGARVRVHLCDYYIRYQKYMIMATMRIINAADIKRTTKESRIMLRPLKPYLTNYNKLVIAWGYHSFNYIIEKLQ